MEKELLTIEHLKKSFGDNVILDDVNLTVKQGEVIVIIGPSGCGKSTLLRCINALEPIQEGQILLDGEKIEPKSKNLTQLRQKIGMVFQSYELFPHLSVLDNIMLAPTKVQKRPKDEVKEEALALLERVGLAEKAKSYPRELSGGQKQRLTIARALVKQPEILIMDDSSSALDYATDAKLRQAIHNMPNRPTVFIVSQRAASIMYADKIIVLDDGTVAGTGTHEELLKDCSVYQEIYYSQFKRTEGGH